MDLLKENKFCSILRQCTGSVCVYKVMRHKANRITEKMVIFYGIELYVLVTVTTTGVCVTNSSSKIEWTYLQCFDI